MAFTGWADLETKMLNDLANGNWRVAEYEVNGERTKFSSFTEFKKVLDYVRTMAAEETGAAVGRTYAGQGGGGRW